jgi:RecB family exonuclease
VEDSALLERRLAGFTPTSLEDLAKCPYRFFAKHVLRLKTPDESVEGGAPSRLGLGKLFHRALELYFQNRSDSNDATRVLDETTLRKACDQAAKEFQERYTGVLPTAMESCKITIFQSLSKYLKTDIEDCSATGFEPRFFEMNVEGSGGSWGKDLEREKFHGRIDRVDVRKTESGWLGRIVEYKSGEEPERGRLETSLIRGKYPQLPIYMQLAKGTLEGKGLSPARIESASLRWVREEDPDIEKFALSEDFWKGPDGPVFLENLAGWVRLAREGRFFIEADTGEHGHCRDCPFARICRKEHMPTRYRTEHDPARLANLRRMERTASRV